LSRYFDKTEYGTYRQVLYVYGTLLVVFSAGLPRVFAYFLPRYEINQGKSIVWKISKLLFFTGALFSIFLFVFSSLIADLLNNQDLSLALKVFSPIPLLLLPTLGMEGIFSTYKKTKYLAIYNTLSRFFMLICIVTPVIFFGGTVISAIYGWILSSLIVFLISIYFKNIPFKGVQSLPDNLSLKEVFTYSIPIVSASLWGIAIKAADQFYISRYFGSAVFAEYSNGFIELPFVSMITGSTAVVLMPVFSKIIHKGDNLEELLSIWKNAILKSATLIYPMVVFFIFFSGEIMTLLYSQQYSDSGLYFKINMILNFFNIVVFAPLIFALGETRFYSRLHMLVAFLAWIFGFIFIHLFNSPLSIAILSVFLSILKVFFALIFVSRKLSISLVDLFPVRKLLSILIHNILVIILIVFLVDYLLIKNTFLKISLSLVGYIFLILSTSNFFRINYLFALSPIINRVKNVIKF
jgi:O-antigen/teichoic acid export membrane protein